MALEMNWYLPRKANYARIQSKIFAHFSRQCSTAINSETKNRDVDHEEISSIPLPCMRHHKVEIETVRVELPDLCITSRTFRLHFIEKKRCIGPDARDLHLISHSSRVLRYAFTHVCLWKCRKIKCNASEISDFSIIAFSVNSDRILKNSESLERRKLCLFNHVQIISILFVLHTQNCVHKKYTSFVFYSPTK